MFCLSHSQHCPPFPFHDLSQSQHCPPFPFHDLSHHNTVHLSHFMTCHSHNTVHLSHFMTCHSHYTVHLSHFMTCHRILNKRNMTGATSGTITTYHFRSLEYTPGFFLWGSCCSIISFVWNVLRIIVYLLFPLCS